MAKKKRAKTGDPLERAREVLLALPGVEQRNSWGFPTFRVGGKIFAATGVRYRGVHLAFRVADPSELEGDDRFAPISEFGSWKRFDDWYFYFFDAEREDDWEFLERLLTVSWELHLALLPKKKQDALLAPTSSKRAHGARPRAASGRRASRTRRRRA